MPIPPGVKLPAVCLPRLRGAGGKLGRFLLRHFEVRENQRVSGHRGRLEKGACALVSTHQCRVGRGKRGGRRGEGPGGGVALEIEVGELGGDPFANVDLCRWDEHL